MVVASNIPDPPPPPPHRPTHAQKIDDNRLKLKHWTGELKRLRKLHQKEAEHWGLEDEDEDDVSDDEDEADMSDEGGSDSDGAEDDADADDKSEAAAEKVVENGVEETKGGEGHAGEQRGEQESEVSVCWPFFGQNHFVPYHTQHIIRATAVNEGTAIGP